ncbi:MAG: LytR family transcriptional regulator, partial [Mycobacterium sp.]
VGNHDGVGVANSQVRAPSVDDLGAQAVSKSLGNLPVIEDPGMTPGTVQVVLSSDYTGPGSGLEGSTPPADPASTEWYEGYEGEDLLTSAETEPPPTQSPIITAGSDDPQCVN